MSWQLAQVNVARLRHPVGAPELAEFTAALARVNALAERAPGVVWRHGTPDGHLSGADLLGDPLTIVNLSVWQSYEHLHDFTYRSLHGNYLRRRSAWFTPLPPPTAALWWVRADCRPTPAHALARLRLLRRQGPSPQAFTLRRRFLADGRPEPRRPRAAPEHRVPPPGSSRRS